jgi:hypothetical protein
MLGFGSLGFGQLPNPDQRTRLDPGAIESGRAGFGNVMFGGVVFPPVPTPAPTPAPVSDQAGGGWVFREPKRRTREEVEQERVDLGIIPAPVEKIVAKAAKRVIARAKQQDASTTAPDPIKYLQEHHAQQRAILAADLRKRQIEADAAQERTYMILLALEIQSQIFRQIEQDREEEQIVMLLMEL